MITADQTPSVLFFGTFDVERHPRVLVLAEGLAALGWSVEFLNRPLSSSTGERVAMARAPWRLVPFAGLLGRTWVKLARDARARDEVPDVVLVGYLATLDVHLARWLFGRKSLVVMDDMAPMAGIAADRGLATGRLGGVPARIDRRARRAADLVLVDTDEHLGEDQRSLVVPVGASQAWFDAGARRAQAEASGTGESEAGGIRVLFFGLFTPLQGATVIAEAIRMVREPIEVTLVGDGQDHPEVARILGFDPRVRHLPWVDADALPDLVAAHDVCLGIFGDTPKARRVVPNKVYQGMAAGCAVITSRTPPQVRMLDEAVRFVAPDAPRELATAIRELADPDVLSAWKQRARRHAEAHFRPARVVSPLDRSLRDSLVDR